MQLKNMGVLTSRLGLFTGFSQLLLLALHFFIFVGNAKGVDWNYAKKRKEILSTQTTIQLVVLFSAVLFYYFIILVFLFVT